MTSGQLAIDQEVTDGNASDGHEEQGDLFLDTASEGLLGLGRQRVEALKELFFGKQELLGR